MPELAPAMDTFELVTLLIVLCAALAYINHRFIRLPNVIGLLILSLGLTTLLWVSNHIRIASKIS